MHNVSLTMNPAASPSPATREGRTIEYLSAPAVVSMADQWFAIASLDHFWVRRRFDVLNRLAGELMSSACEMAEIGCGHGLLQRQIEDHFSKSVAGFDLNEYALLQNVSRKSRVCCYDIFRRDNSLRHRFDIVFLFDVIEHVVDEASFLDAVRFHLAPEGRLILNVPAGQWAFSAYDVAAGHVRRYSIDSLRETATRSNLQVENCTYWGLSLTPVLALRKLWLLRKKDQSQIISAGFDSRNSFANQALGFLARLEPLPQTVLGTSLLAVLRPTASPVK